METLSDVLRDHLRAPRNVGRLDPPARRGRGRNDACGDDLHLWVSVVGGRLAAVRFQARGCSSVLATASLLTEALAGLPEAEARALDVPGLVAGAGGLPPRGRHAVGVAERALREALEGGPCSAS